MAKSRSELIRSDHIKHALSKRHTDDFFATEVKNGPSHSSNDLLIMDAFAMKKSWANPCLSGYEIKVSRADFQKDTKWPGYLNYCNQFSFVCPTGLIQLEELPDEVGLIYYNPDKQTLYTKRKAQYRLIDVPNELYLYLMMNRFESSQHPFFTDRKEYFEAFLEDKADRKQIGYRVGSKMAKELQSMNKKYREMELDVEGMKEELEQAKKVYKILSSVGIRPSRYYSDWEERLQERLRVGVSTHIKNEVFEIRSKVNRLHAMLEPQLEEIK
jgi:hypothetical protein